MRSTRWWSRLDRSDRRRWICHWPTEKHEWCLICLILVRVCIYIYINNYIYIYVYMQYVCIFKYIYILCKYMLYIYSRTFVSKSRARVRPVHTPTSVSWACGPLPKTNSVEVYIGWWFHSGLILTIDDGYDISQVNYGDLGLVLGVLSEKTAIENHITKLLLQIVQINFN